MFSIPCMHPPLQQELLQRGVPQKSALPQGVASANSGGPCSYLTTRATYTQVSSGLSPAASRCIKTTEKLLWPLQMHETDDYSSHCSSQGFEKPGCARNSRITACLLTHVIAGLRKDVKVPV